MQSGEDVRPQMEHCMAFFTVELSCGICDTRPSAISVILISKGLSSPMPIFTEASYVHQHYVRIVCTELNPMRTRKRVEKVDRNILRCGAGCRCCSFQNTTRGFRISHIPNFVQIGQEISTKQ